MARAIRTNALVAMALAGAACLAACDTSSPPGTSATCDLAPGELLITEVMARPETAALRVEWFAVYTPSGRRLSLAGVVLEVGTATNPRTHRIPALLDPGLDPGAYLAIGNGTLSDGISGYAWPQMSMADTEAIITIRCGEAIVDRVAYGATAAGPGAAVLGASWQLSSRLIPDAGAPVDPASNDTPDQWCAPADDAVYDAQGDRGTPGGPNRECILGNECVDGEAVRPLVAPAAGDLVITEVYGNAPGADSPDKEWIEVHALKDVDLAGLLVVNLNGTTADATTPTSKSYAVGTDTCVHIAAGTWGLLAGSADPAKNDGLPAVTYAFPADFLLYYGSKGSATVSIQDVDGNVIAQAVYPTCKDGVSQQLDAQFGANAPAAGDPLNWCASTTTGVFGQTGTPGAPNVSCTAP